MKQLLFSWFTTAACVGGFAAETVWLHTLDLTPMRQGYGTPQIDRGIR